MSTVFSERADEYGVKDNGKWLANTPETLCEGKSVEKESQSPPEEIINRDLDNERALNELKRQYEALEKRYNQEILRFNKEIGEKEKELKKSKKDLINSQIELSSLNGHSEVLEFKRTHPLAYEAVAKMLNVHTSRLQSAVLDGLEKKIDELRGFKEKALESLFQEFLSQKEPEWKAIMETTEFKNWLQGRECYTNELRKDLLEKAFRSFDVQRAADFFKDYAHQKSQKLKGCKHYIRVEKKPCEKIYDNIEEGTITEKKVQKFYNDLAVGKYSGREQEAMKIEEKIAKALRNRKIISK